MVRCQFEVETYRVRFNSTNQLPGFDIVCLECLMENIAAAILEVDISDCTLLFRPAVFAGRRLEDVDVISTH